MQAVLWPSSDDTPAVVSGAGVGCWDMHVDAGLALALGLVVQARMDSSSTISGANTGARSGSSGSSGGGPTMVISAAAPGVLDMVGSDGEAAPVPSARLWMPGVQLSGDNCTMSAAGTNVSIALDSNGATASVRCTVH